MEVVRWSSDVLVLNKNPITKAQQGRVLDDLIANMNEMLIANKLGRQ